MEENINIQEILEAIKKRWKLILICVLTATLIASIVTLFLIKPQYESKTKVFIGKEEGEGQAYNQNDIAMYQKLLKTYSEIIKTKDLLNVAIKESNIDVKTNEVLSNLSVVPVADTQIIEIKYKGTSSSEAAILLNEVKKEFVKVAKDLVPNVNIRVLEDVRENKVPVSPNKKMNITIAVLLGAIGGIGIVFLLEFIDNSFKTKDQLENRLGVPVLGVIPNHIEGVRINGRTSNKH